MRLLVIEDDIDVADVVVAGLRRHHLAVDHVDQCAGAVEAAALVTYDVVVLDLGLPDGDGLDLCRWLVRGETDDGMVVQVPHRILILTARDAVSARVAGLDVGADDYLVKPFKLTELAARVRALGRRSDNRQGPLVVGDIRVDVAAGTVVRAGQPVVLTGREFSVLRYLTSHRGEIVTAEDLLEHCWDANANPFTGSVRVIISRVRRKLGDPDPITTINGVGYRLEAP
jgi:DNA-binding response OmpR family regulator